MRFSEYSGGDYLEWDTSPGALSDTSYDLAVYRTWPSKPYAVLGDARHKDPRKEWKESEIKDAVKAAKAKGGDAIIIRHTSEGGVSVLTGGERRFEGNFVQFQTTALVIRWQTPTEIAARRDRDERLLRQLLASKPGFESNQDTASLVVLHLLRSGNRDTDPDFFKKYYNLMIRTTGTQPGLAGDWMFKATLQDSGIVRREAREFLGIATVKPSRDGLAIVSVEGNTEISFSGTIVDGRIDGQIGIAGTSIPARGVALGHKVSLSFQSLTQNGTRQGNLVLQRNTISLPQSTPAPATNL